jgi:hypothetical protein
MASFAKNVFGLFVTLRKEFNFVPAHLASGRDIARLVKKLTDNLYLYIFVDDDRDADSLNSSTHN